MLSFYLIPGTNPTSDVVNVVYSVLVDEYDNLHEVVNFGYGHHDCSIVGCCWYMALYHPPCLFHNSAKVNVLALVRYY